MMKSKDKNHNLIVSNNLSNSTLDFLENIKIKLYQTLSPSFMNNFLVANTNLYYKKIVKNRYHNVDLCDKEYDLATKRSLNQSEENFIQLMRKRQSSRSFQEIMDKEKLFKILRLSYFSHNYENVKKRNSPSGGAMYPIEIYFLNLNINELEKGVFYYNVDHEKLQLTKRMDDKTIKEFVTKAFLTDRKSDIEYHKSSGVIILCGILGRSTFKYNDLGVKLAFIDAGAILQNFYLSCALTNTKCCACNGYIDSYIERVIDMKSKTDTIITTIFVGN